MTFERLDVWGVTYPSIKKPAHKVSCCSMLGDSIILCSHYLSLDQEEHTDSDSVGPKFHLSLVEEVIISMHRLNVFRTSEGR